MQSQWRIELFGGLRIFHGDRGITRFRTQKAGALLGYLAYHLDRMHPRDELLEALWPESNRDAAQNRLRVELHSLRHQLEPPGVPPGSLLVTSRLSVGLNPEAVRTDAAAFESAIRDSRQAGSDIEREQALRIAVSLYCGALLQGYYEDWIAPERERLEELFFQALHGLILSLQQSGDIEGAIAFARQGVNSDPAREAAHADLMRLYASAGQPLLALRQYRELEQILKQETGEKPGPETRSLAQELMRSTVSAPQTALNGGQRAAEAPPAPAGRSLPGGTVTFLLTDIENLAQLRDEPGGDLSAVLSRYRQRLRQQLRRHKGRIVQEAEGFCAAAFSHASHALECAVAIQKIMAGTAKDNPHAAAPVRVRIAMDTREVEPKAGKYPGSVLDGARRLLLAGHGGQILCSEETSVLLRRDLRPGLRLKDLGAYRLGEGATSERVIQIEHPDMPQPEFPPLHAETAYPISLPLPFNRFFGREEEMAHLREQLLSQSVRLVTLTGPPGSGKTRLALETARQLADAFGGAAWFAPLADLSDARLIPDAILTALRIPRSPQDDPLEQAVEALSRRASLLVLDNIEQLVEGGAETVRLLLERVLSLTALVTSRQRLGISGEREFPLMPLPIPLADDSPESRAGCPSVRLFLDRAQAVRPDFQIKESNASSIASLCARLEGIPLAIELAAAQVRLLPPGRMLSRWHRRFDFLESRQRDVRGRHRTLKAAIDWSYRLLAPEVQRFFSRLSVFRGGWMAEAAEAVCEEPQAPEYLAQLVECSMVIAEDTEQGVRYRMLEMLREFGREQLGEEEWDYLQQRHFVLILHYCEQNHEGWQHDLSNVEAALAYCSTMPDTRKALRFPRLVENYWQWSGRFTEGRSIMADLLSRKDPAVTAVERASALEYAGEWAFWQGDLKESISLLEESLAIYRTKQDYYCTAHVLDSLSTAYQLAGSYDIAHDLAQESIDILRRLDKLDKIPSVCYNLAQIAYFKGEYSTARSLFQKVIDASQLIDPSTLWLARISLQEGDLVAARDIAEQCLSKGAWSQFRKANILAVLGEITFAQSRLAEAKLYYMQSLPIYKHYGDKNQGNRLLRNMATLAAAQGQAARAARIWGAEAASQHQRGVVARPYFERWVLESHLIMLQKHLGDIPFTAAWQAGQAMTWEEAVAYVLEEAEG